MNSISSIVLALLMTAAPALAQQPAEHADSHPDFSGTWTLDRTLSNDPAQANFDAAPQNQNRSGGSRGGGGFGGFGGFGGMGRGGGSRTGGSRPAQNPETNTTPDEKARLAALTDQLKKASSTLVISHHDPSFVVNDAKNETWFLETTASRTDQQVGDVKVSATTHWQDERVIAEFVISSRRTLVYTFTLVPSSKHLVLRVRPQFTDHPAAGDNELKLVYSLAAPAKSH